jgi:hypothetical protein
MNGTPGNLQTTIHGIYAEECVTNPNKNLLAGKKKHVVEGRRQTLHQSFLYCNRQQASKQSIGLPPQAGFQ